jgi:hypothetical protein
MKLVALFLASLLALPAAARADEVLNPPGGPVFVEANHSQPEAGTRDPQRRHKNRELKRALMLQFDVNGDGRLGPRERQRAIRVLEKIQRKLAGRADGPQRGQQVDRGAQAQPRRQKMRRFIQRFDTNGDGTVDRSEMPPGAANKLRRLDRDGSGWVEPGELR